MYHAAYNLLCMCTEHENRANAAGKNTDLTLCRSEKTGKRSIMFCKNILFKQNKKIYTEANQYFYVFAYAHLKSQLYD